MSDLQNYIKPELLVLIPVLYVLGLIIKNSTLVKDKYIPLILGVFSIILSSIYVIAVSGTSLMCVFTAITQGVLVTGVAVYINQLFKQSNKGE